ncbi:hypothetical protein BRADI_1g12325v3 [Brachypodium distachyon]|uniref:RNase H type-1 domain-containing protein n=1 Tax=Brachypodium distachyon TaxID=15368 RepID=A0A0Q3JPA9_BRADI|nr:hypothetical protein BRADI_1g12325v3 [Brachypodium distachyon]
MKDCYQALVRCPHAKALWSAMREDWAIPDLEKTVQNEPKWLLNALDKMNEIQRKHVVGLNGKQPKKTGARDPQSPWLPLELGQTKLNVDGSFALETGTADTGMLLRDERGKPIIAACRALRHCNDPLEAKLKACVEGLQLAMQHTQLLICLETDCAEAAKLIGERTSLLELSEPCS